MKAIDVPLGARVKVHGIELLVTRKDHPFLGRAEMVCLVEDTDERWACAPAPVDMEIEAVG